MPVGAANTNDTPLKSSSSRVAMRFVLDETADVRRLFVGWKLRGARDCGPQDLPDPRPGYGAGDGGTIRAELVPVRSDGTPDTATVLASDTFNGCERYTETRREFGLEPGGLQPVLWPVNLGEAHLRGDTPYALVLRNAHEDPAANFSSPNWPTTDVETAGPQGRNELNPVAPGAVMGLDPRESLSWSDDGGESWSWGPEVGTYQGEGFDAVRLPQYGYQATDAGAAIRWGQPYYAYRKSGTNLEATFRRATRTVTVTRAGGFSASGDVGLITVTNLTRGETATGDPGSGAGLRTAALSRPLTIRAGDTYTVRAAGNVEILKADQAQRNMFPGLADLPQVFVLPHPFYEDSTPFEVATREGGRLLLRRFADLGADLVDDLGLLRTSSAPAVAAEGARSWLFETDLLGRVSYRLRGDSAWTSWSPAMTVDATSAPAAASPGTGTLGVAVRGRRPSFHTWFRTWTPSGWAPWVDLGGKAASAPALAASQGRFDAFVRGDDGAIYWKPAGYCSSRGCAWYPRWTTLGGRASSDPAAVSWASGRVDLFWRNAGDNSLTWRRLDASGWAPPVSLGMAETRGTPAVSSARPGRLDLFVRGLDNQLHHRWYDTRIDASATGWSAVRRLGGNLSASPGAMARSD